MVQGRTITVSLCLILLSTILIVWLGLTGIARGDDLEGGSEYARRQVVWLAMGAVTTALVWMVPYRRLLGWGLPLYLLTMVMLVAVFFFPAKFGARRWILIGPISVQPSELAKIAYILALSEYLMFRRNHRTIPGLIIPFAMTVVPVLLILKEPDLGTALLFFPVLFGTLYVAGARRLHLAATLLAGLAVAPILWTQMNAEQKSRVTALFTQRDGVAPDMSDGYHLHQSKQMLALGGVRGSVLDGEAVKDPRAYRLPAGRTDFVFCLVGERLGIAGTLGTLLMFSLFVLAGANLAASTRDPFGRLVCTGIVMILSAQAVINTAMTVGLAPVTGLTLPLMSYGGSSLVTTGISLGILLNIAQSPNFDVAGQPFQFSGQLES